MTNDAYKTVFCQSVPDDTFNRDACDGSKINLSCSHKSWARPDVTISSFRQVSCPSESSI